MNHRMKNILLGAGSIQLFPRPIDYKYESEAMLTRATIRSGQESITISEAINLSVAERMTGQWIMFITMMSSMIGSSVLALNDCDGWSVVLSISTVVIYLTITTYADDKLKLNIE